MVRIIGESMLGFSRPGELFQILRDGKARTKAELASMTGLARSTISSRIDLLLASGVIAGAGEATSSGGRPPSLIAFDPGSRAVVAVDLTATHALVAVADLNGVVIKSQGIEMSIAEGPDVILTWVVETATELLATSGRTAADLLGVGIGVPGPVEHSTGRPTNPPIMPGWDQFDIPAFVQRHFSVPVLVDNDVNVLALGEHAMVWPDFDDLIFVKVSTGIGLGIISGGQLQRGAQGTAGDMGHVQVPYSRDSPREATDERDLEAVASGPAIAKYLDTKGIHARTSADVVRLVQEGNPEAIRATRQAGREVGEVLATVVNLLNPSIIVIGGSIARAGEHLLAGVREAVYRRSIPLATQHLRIVPSRGGGTDGVRGAAMLVIQQALSPAAIDQMVASPALA